MPIYTKLITFFRLLQLVLRSTNALHQGATVAKNNLTALDLDLEADLLPAVLDVTSLPRRRNKLVTTANGAGKASLVLLDVGRVAAAKVLEKAVGSPVPRVQTVNDDAAEAHLLAGLRVDVEGVVVAVEAVQDGGLGSGLVLENDIGLLVLGRGEVLGGGALGTAPVALVDVEGGGVDARVNLVGGGIYDVGLGLDNGAGAALVINTGNLGPRLELLALRGGGKLLEELDPALTVNDTGRVEDRDARDVDGLLGGVEVDYI